MVSWADMGILGLKILAWPIIILGLMAVARDVRENGFLGRRRAR